jgi:hypothetical protein
MKNQLTLSGILLCSGVLALAMSPASADPACDAEILVIQSEMNTPAAGVSSSDLEQAQHMLNVLSQDCTGGSSLDDVASLANAIRSLLGLGGAQ